jgi:hypothetical protein
MVCGYCGLDWNSGVSGHAQSRNESGSYGTLVVVLWVLACLMIISIVPQIMHVVAEEPERAEHPALSVGLPRCGPCVSNDRR